MTTGLWFGNVGYTQLRWPPRPGKRAGLVILHPVQFDSWTVELEIKEDLFEHFSPVQTQTCEDSSQCNQGLFLYSSRKWACVTSLVSVASSTQFEGNERPLSSLFIRLVDGWIYWIQLTRQWQEALHKTSKRPRAGACCSTGIVMPRSSATIVMMPGRSWQITRRHVSRRRKKSCRGAPGCGGDGGKTCSWDAPSKNLCVFSCCTSLWLNTSLLSGHNAANIRRPGQR